MALDLKPLKLKSPCGQGYLSFEWNESINNKLPSDSIMETIRWVCKEYSVLKSIIDIKVIRPIDRSNYDDMQALCGRFNHVIDTFLSMSKGTSMVCGNPVASSELLKWILEFVYMRAIPQPFLLNKCKPNALPETYGETNYEQVKKIIQKLNVQPDDTFIDLGSGIGHIVLQVAASTPCRTCVGIEKENTRAHYATQMDKHFTVVMKWFGKKFHNYQLIKGDFLDSEYHHDLIYQSTIIFVNNFAFRDVNHKLKALFGNLENNTRIVSTYPFRTESFRISDRNLDDPAAIMRVSKYMSDDGAFSWTQNPVPYYIQIIDRSLLQEYFDNLNNQDSIKNPQHQQHHHKHRRRSRDLLSTSQQHQQPRLPNGDAVGRRRGSGSYGSSSSVSSLASASAPAPSGKSVPPHSSAGTGTGSKKLLLKAEFFPDTLSDSSSSSSSSNASSLNKTLPLLPLTKNHNATAVNKNNKNVSHQVKNNSSSLPFVVKKDTTTTANVKENIARGNKGSSKLVNSQHPQLTNSSIANKSNHKYLTAKKIHPAATSSSTAVSVGGGGGPPSKKATTSGLGSAGQTSSTTLISKPFYTSSSSLSSMGSPPRTPSAAAHHNTDPFIHLATTSASTDPFHKVSITSAAGGTSIEISSQQLLNKSSGSNNNCMLSTNKKLKREHAIISPSQSDEEKKLIHSSKKLIKNTAMTTTGLLAQIKPLLVERQVSTKKTSATNPDIFNHASSSTTKRKLSPPPPIKSANAPRTSAPLTQQINGPPRTSKIDYGPPSSDEDIFSSSHHPSKIKIAVTTAGAALDTKINANKLGKSSQLLPIFLPEGTRVLTLTDGTRKAKVRKLGLELRVRVRLKDNKFVSLGQDQINGTVEVGALVEILKAGDHFASKGTIDKITDRTSYTLEFGNGETKIVKRNQIKQILHLGLRNYSKFMGSTGPSTADKQRSSSPPLPSFLFTGVGTTGTVKITHPSPLPPATASKVTAGILKTKSTAASTDFGGLQTAPPLPLSPFTPSNHSSTSTTATSSTPSSPQHEGLLEELPLGSSSASQRNNRAVSSPQKFDSLNGLVSQQQLPPTTVPAGLLSKRKRGTIDFESSLDLLHQHTVNSIHRSAISSTHNSCNDYYTGSLTGTCGVVRSQPSSFSSQYRTQNQTGMVASLVFTKPQTVSTSSFRHIKDTLMKVFYQICALETKMNLPTVPANDDDSAAPHGSVDGTTVSDASLDSKFLAKIQGQTLAQLSVNQTMAVKLSLAEQAKRDIILDISKLLQHKMNKLDSSITKPMNLSHFAKNVVNLQQNLKSSIVKADSEIEYLSAKNRELKDRLTEFSKILTPPNAGAAVGSALLANFVSPTFQPHHHHQHQNLTQMTNQAAGVKAAKNISATFLIPPPPLVNNSTNFKSSLPLVNNSNYSSPLLLAHSTPAPVSYAANLTVTENTVTVSPLLRVNCGAGGIRRQLPAVVVAAPPLPNSTPKFPSLVAAPATPITNLQPLKTFVNTAGGATSSHHNNSLSLGNTQQTFSTNSSILLAPNATIPSSQHHQHQQQALFSKLILEYQQHLARQFGPAPALNNPNPSIANSNSSFPFFNYNSVGAANYFNNFSYTTQPHTPSSGAPPPPPQIVPIRAAIVAAPSAASQLPYGGISTSAQQSRVTPSPPIVSATVTHTTSLASSGVATTLAALNLPTVDGNSTSTHCCSNNNHVTATPLVISVGSGCQVTELAAVDDDPVACATYVRNVIAKAMIESHLAALPSSATGSSTTSSPSSSSVTVVCTTNPKTPPTTTGVATVSAIKSFPLLTAETSYAHLPEAEGAAPEMIISRSSQISKLEPAKSPSEMTEVILPATLKFSNSAAAVANSCTPAVVIPKITTAVSPESPFTPTTHLSTTVITTIPILTTTPTQTHDRLQDTLSNTTNSLATTPPPPPKFDDIKDNSRNENCEKLENSSAIPISQPDMIVEDTGSRLIDCSQAITTIGNEITKAAVMPADDDQVKVVNPTIEARDDALITTKTSIESNETINITNTMNSSFEAAINTGTTSGTWTTLSTSSTVIGERFFKRSNKESRPSHKLVTVVSQQQLHGNNSAGGIAVSAPTTTITTYPHYHHHPILPSNNNDSRSHSINTSPTTTLISPIPPKPIITTATTTLVASDLVVRPDTIITDCGNVALTSPSVSVENSASLVTQAQLKPLYRGSVIVTVATAPILATISSHDTLDSTDVFNPPSVKEAEILPENERITPIPTPTTPPFSTTSKNNCCSERDKPLKKRNNNSSVSGGGSSSQTDRGGDYCNESNSSFNTASSPPPIPPTPPATVIPLASSTSSSTLKKSGVNKFLTEDPQTPLSLQQPPLPPPPPPSLQSSIIYNNNNNKFVVEDEELQNKKKSLIEQNIENAIDTVLANVNNNNYNWYKPAIASEFSSSVNSLYTDDYNLNRGGGKTYSTSFSTACNNNSSNSPVSRLTSLPSPMFSSAASTSTMAAVANYYASSSSSSNSNNHQQHHTPLMITPPITTAGSGLGGHLSYRSSAAAPLSYHNQQPYLSYFMRPQHGTPASTGVSYAPLPSPPITMGMPAIFSPPPPQPRLPPRQSSHSAAAGGTPMGVNSWLSAVMAACVDTPLHTNVSGFPVPNHHQQQLQQQQPSSSSLSSLYQHAYHLQAAAAQRNFSGGPHSGRGPVNNVRSLSNPAAAAAFNGGTLHKNHHQSFVETSGSEYHHQQQQHSNYGTEHQSPHQQQPSYNAVSHGSGTTGTVPNIQTLYSTPYYTAAHMNSSRAHYSSQLVNQQQQQLFTNSPPYYQGVHNHLQQQRQHQSPLISNYGYNSRSGSTSAAAAAIVPPSYVVPATNFSTVPQLPPSDQMSTNPTTFYNNHFNNPKMGVILGLGSSSLQNGGNSQTHPHPLYPQSIASPSFYPIPPSTPPTITNTAPIRLNTAFFFPPAFPFPSPSSHGHVTSIPPVAATAQIAHNPNKSSLYHSSVSNTTHNDNGSSEEVTKPKNSQVVDMLLYSTTSNSGTDNVV